MRSGLDDRLPAWRSIRPVLTLVDPLAVVAAGLGLRAAVGDGLDAVPLLLAALTALLVCRGADLHRSRLVLSVVDDLPRLALAATAAGLVLVALTPAQVTATEQAWSLLASTAATLVLMVLLRSGVYAVAHVRRRNGRSAHPVVVVGAGAVGLRLTRAFLERREFGLLPVGIVDSAPTVDPRDLPVPLLGAVDALERVLADLGVDDVVFAFPDPPDEDMVDLVRRCVQADRQVFVVPRFFEMMGLDRHGRTEVIGDVAVMRLRRWGLRPGALLAKRTLDVALSAVALLLLSPVLLACALAVRLETGPGVIFRQTRIGRGGRPFTLYKFRSLKPRDTTESATQWSITHDDRVGPVGRFLRRTSLDELPQLVNVLRGDMSLVGPRPERPFFVRQFSKVELRYDDRHRVQTGLTGWAQVHQLRGDTAIDARVRHDNYYIENWSLWTDLKIMARTVLAIVRHRADDRSPLVLTGPPPGESPATASPASPGLPVQEPLPHVLHVSMPTTEGVAVMLLAYVKDQLARGWTVTVACPDNGWLPQAAREAGAYVVRWDASRNPGPGLVGEVRRLRRVVNDARPDVVHLHSAKAGLAGRLLLRGALPTIFQPHAWSFQAVTGPMRRATTAWERFAQRWTTELVCVSRSERAIGEAAGIITPTIISPNGVDLGRFGATAGRARTAARQVLGLPDLPTVVCVGRLARQKGQADLLEAWDEVHERVPGARLVLVGDGPDRAALETQVAGRSDVLLAGARSDVSTWLAAADVVAVPSRWEGMAVVPLEAMAAGRSVVATAVAGIAESLPRGGGLVVPVGDVAALADGLAARLLDPALAEREGAVGRRHAAEHHDVNASAAEVARLTLAQLHRRRGTADPLMALGPMPTARPSLPVGVPAPRREEDAVADPAPVTDLAPGAVLVTGGAGYIGAHVLRELEGLAPVVVVDDLSTGRADRVPADDLVVLDLTDHDAPERLRDLMVRRRVRAVVHLAARKQVGESVEQSTWYYNQNVGGLANLLLAMEQAGVSELVYSSSAAVYGEVDGGPVREDDPCRPANPYGETKLVGEWMCRDAGRAWGLRWTALRYFNVAGAASPELADPGASNLVPLVLDAVAAGRAPQIYGADHDTPDGTCLRDFVDVRDLARAHVAALDHVGSPSYGPSSPTEFNIGTGQASSVADVIAQVARTVGRDIRAEVVARRSGDPASVVADPSRALDVLGWKAEHGLEDIISSAWRARSAAPLSSVPSSA